MAAYCMQIYVEQWLRIVCSPCHRKMA